VRAAGGPPGRRASLLDAAGKVVDTDYELHFYPGQGHGFTGDAVDLSTQGATSFLTRHLGAG
jgi:hypothetical protein